MANRRSETFLTLIVLAIGVAFASVLGLFQYMSLTATPLHPTPRDVPSVGHSAPLPQWIDAVARGRQIVRTALTEQNLPGLSVAVGSAGDIVWAEGFGWADLDRRVPVAPETRFPIGTASIPLTSAAVGLLLENGRLNLDDRIQAYVPELSEKEWPVTLRQLMGHTAGVANDGGDEGPLFARHCVRPVEAFQFLSGYERELLFDPGTEQRFSSYGWIMVSAAVEAAAATPFATFMRSEVFEPLGMNDTRADSATELAANRATSYFPRFAADPRYGPDPLRPADYSCYGGASGFVSTPSDLVRFAFAIRNGTLLQPATVQILQTSQRLASGLETGYGLGWDLSAVTLGTPRTRAVGHDGDSFGGMVASLVAIPAHGMVVSVTSNISYADTFALAVKIAQAFAEPVNTPAHQ